MKRLLMTSLNPLVLKYIQRIAEFSKQWEFSADIKKDFYAGLKKTTIVTSAGASTRIEGSHLSDEEILKRLEGLSIQKIQDRDDAEVAGYIDCINHIFDNFHELSISEHTIRSLHQMMCEYLSDDVLPGNQKGAYKNVVNSVVSVNHTTGEKIVIFETTPPGIETEMAMKQLIEDYDNYINDPNFSELEVIAAFIIKFLAIHPFRDGNGRMARLLTNLCLLKQGYEFCMYSSHEKAIEDNKESYYISLRQTQSTIKGESPDLNPWLLFFLKMLDRQASYLEQVLVPKKTGTLTNLEDKVITLIQAHQPVTIGFLERESGIKRPTLKSILARLKEEGLIEMEGERKGSRYRLK